MKTIFLKTIIYTFSHLLFILLAEKIFKFGKIDKYVQEGSTEKEPWFHRKIRYLTTFTEKNKIDFIVTNFISCFLAHIINNNYNFPELGMFNLPLYHLVIYFIIAYINNKIYFYNRKDANTDEEGKETSVKIHRYGAYSVVSIKEEYLLTIILVGGFSLSTNILSNIFLPNTSE